MCDALCIFGSPCIGECSVGCLLRAPCYIVLCEFCNHSLVHIVCIAQSSSHFELRMTVDLRRRGEECEDPLVFPGSL